MPLSRLGKFKLHPKCPTDGRVLVALFPIPTEFQSHTSSQFHPVGRATCERYDPETWVTDCTQDMGDNLVPNGLSMVYRVFCSSRDRQRPLPRHYPPGQTLQPISGPSCTQLNAAMGDWPERAFDVAGVGGSYRSYRLLPPTASTHRHTQRLLADADHDIVAIQADLLRSGLRGGEQDGAGGDTAAALAALSCSHAAIRQGSGHNFGQEELCTFP